MNKARKVGCNARQHLMHSLMDKPYLADVSLVESIATRALLAIARRRRGRKAGLRHRTDELMKLANDLLLESINTQASLAIALR